MRILVLVSAKQGVRVYTDAPANALVIDEDCPEDFTEGYHQRISIKNDSETLAWELSGAVFSAEVGLDPQFVHEVFDAGLRKIVR
jgi:hypothetical protein